MEKTHSIEDSAIKAQLQDVLCSSKRTHTFEINKEPNLKYAHIYCKIHRLSGQISGPLIEHYFIHKFKMTKNKSALCIGDVNHKQSNFELKASVGGKDNNRFNYVQLRMNHCCDYILTAYYIDSKNIDNLGELFVFKLQKKYIIEIILKYGGYAHGTIQKLGVITREDLENPHNDKEYAFRPKYGDECWSYLLQFRTDEFCI